MSRHHSSVATEVRYLIRDVNAMLKEEGGAEEVMRVYGIEINEAGGVFDTTFVLTFDSIPSWAQFTVEQEHANDVDVSSYDESDDDSY